MEQRTEVGLIYNLQLEYLVPAPGVCTHFSCARIVANYINHEAVVCTHLIRVGAFPKFIAIMHTHN